MAEGHGTFTNLSPSAEQTGSHDSGVDGTKEGTDGREEVTVTTEMEDIKGLELQRSVSLMGAVSFTVGTMIGKWSFLIHSCIDVFCD